MGGANQGRDRESVWEVGRLYLQEITLRLGCHRHVSGGMTASGRMPIFSVDHLNVRFSDRSERQLLAQSRPPAPPSSVHRGRDLPRTDEPDSRFQSSAFVRTSRPRVAAPYLRSGSP
jgi:hypothetical protein